MSSVKKVEAMPHHTCLYYWLVGMLALFFGACSSGTHSGEDFVSGDGGHVDNWANIAFLRTDMFHGSEVKDVAASGATDPAITVDLCAECHGLDLDGGISRISCFSCHNGPDGVIHRPNHPAGWLANRDDMVLFHGVYARAYPTSCTGFCHGHELTGGIGPNCFDCHTARDLADVLRDMATADSLPDPP
jgi:hypothetical protein